MKLDPVGLLARAATLFAETSGLRDSMGEVAEILRNELPAKLAFVARLRRDSGVADIIGASGIGAADFRRLEARLSKSTVWRIFQLSTPVAIDDLSRDAALSFLGFSTGARLLLSQPIIFRGSTIGLVGVGFASTARVDEDRIIKLLEAIAAMIAHAMRVERTIADENRRLAEENTQLKHELKEKYDFKNLIGNSLQMRQVYDQVTQVARSNATILIRGESGTGKEFIADALHYNSLRSKRPLIKVNCDIGAEPLATTELFGIDRAGVSRKKGALESADGGTLFLDEVGGLAPATQHLLAKALAANEFRRPDGTVVPINVRLIAASGVDLEAAVANGSFDSSLLDQIGGFMILLPPLRERKSDILLLAEHFLERYQSEHNKIIRRLSTPAIDMLTAYHFPGNVRELENAIERAVIACDSSVLHGHHLPPTLQTAELTGTETRVTLASAVEAFERDMIQDTLKSSRGNIAKAAKMLDSTERILGYKIKKYGVNPRRFR